MKRKSLKFYASAVLIIILVSCMHESALKSTAPAGSKSESAFEYVNAELTSAGAISENSDKTGSEPDLTGNSGSRSDISLVPAFFSPEKTEGEDEVAAILKAYGNRIDNVSYSENDWMISLDGRRFYWSGGRLLPEEKAGQSSKYRAYGFYKYPEKLPPLDKVPTPQQLERIKRYSEAIKSHPRDNAFLETLYKGKTLDEILKSIRYINFLGYKIEVHESLIPAYKAIEREIMNEAQVNSDVKKYLDSLGSVSAFNWRRIEDSISRSYHSFGIAVDMVPANIKGKEIYWNWTRVFNPQWYSVPYSKRWMVPDEIVGIFEKYGFIWGGKWLFYDNMHFEYRPEILILSGKKVVKL